MRKYAVRIRFPLLQRIRFQPLQIAHALLLVYYLFQLSIEIPFTIKTENLCRFTSSQPETPLNQCTRWVGGVSGDQTRSVEAEAFGFCFEVLKS